MPDKSEEQRGQGPGERDRDSSLRVDRADGSGPLAGRDPETVEAARRFSIEAARSLEDDKCEDVLVLDLRGLSVVTDFFVVASGTSERQMRSAGQHIHDLGKERGFEVYHSNLRSGPTTWYVIDFVDVVVHIFDPEERSHYDLEMLWGDATRLSWARRTDQRHEAAQESRNRAGLREDDVIPGSQG